jgi:hypothetical protein
VQALIFEMYDPDGASTIFFQFALIGMFVILLVSNISLHFFILFKLRDKPHALNQDTRVIEVNKDGEFALTSHWNRTNPETNVILNSLILLQPPVSSTEQTETIQVDSFVHFPSKY